MERRKFIRNTLSFVALIAMHNTAQACATISNNPMRKVSPKTRFKKLILNTSVLQEQFNFYSNVLGFEIKDKTETQFSIVIGESILIFKETEEEEAPFYHYAINIPSNKHLEAKTWLAERTPLLRSGNNGEDILYFDFWDAHAIYFKDPAGNIGELIARHSLDNDRDGTFGLSDMLCVSEIGTPVENTNDMYNALKSNYGLKSYGESMFVGDENGLFVVVPVSRMWFPEYTQRAAVYPIDINISDKGPLNYKFPGYPYVIHGQD
jgi:catechol 2,3-dioxygenase-like lactoylglutathione lyase family enzyme